jgi:hypothetical protein
MCERKELTVNQIELLQSMVNASIQRAAESGIPVAKEFYNAIDNIKEWLENERCRGMKGVYNK